MSYFGNAGQLLVTTFFGLAMVVLLLRILLQAAGANFYNPICQLLHRATEPVLGPLRRLIPRVGKIELAGVLLLIAISWLRYLLLKPLGGTVPPFIQIDAAGLGALFVAAVAYALLSLLLLWLALLIIRIVLSFIRPDSQNPAIPLIFQITEPLLAPFQRLLPQSPLDFSPIFVFLGIQLARLLIVNPLFDLAARMAIG